LWATTRVFLLRKKNMIIILLFVWLIGALSVMKIDAMQHKEPVDYSWRNCLISFVLWPMIALFQIDMEHETY
jgi:hypothetical protein